MTSKARSKQELLVEVADLRLRMAEAEDILRAIREYEVDALVVKAGHGDQVFALESADHAYRQMVEQMREGAATLAVDGTVLYVNRQLARLMQCAPAQLLGEPFGNCLVPVDQSRVSALLAAPEGGRLAAHLRVPGGARVPVSLSASRLVLDEQPVVLLLITDLTYEKQADHVARLLELSKRLAAAVTGTQVAEAIITGALRAVDAVAGFVAVAGEDGAPLRILHAVGYSDDHLKEIRALVVRPGNPLSDALAARDVVKVETYEERQQRYSDWLTPTPEGEAGALLAVPMLLPERVVGGLHLDFAGPRSFEPDDRDFALTVAQQCAQALESASLYSELERRVLARTAELQAANSDLGHANRQLVAEIAERREAQRQAERSREEERARVARELHDELGSTLTVLKMEASRLLRDPELPAGPRQRLDTMLATIHTAIQSVRHLSTELRPQMLDDLGLLPALESYLHDFTDWSGVKGHFSSDVQRLDLDGEAATACFRIVQEALTNVARHAQATEVTVRVVAAGDCVQLSVTDNGRGLKADERAAHGHFGLVGMKERAQLLSASLEIESAPGQGTTVLLSLPSAPPEPAA